MKAKPKTKVVSSRRKRINRGKVGEFAWHLHHNSLYDMLREPASARVKFIRENKPSDQIPIRLKWFTRVKNQKLLRKLIENNDYNGELKLHKKEHPKCPWRRYSNDPRYSPPEGRLFSGLDK